MSDPEIIEKAKKRVQDKKDFYGHLTAFIMVGSMLFFINLFTDPETWWFVFPMFGWSFGLLAHYLSVFGGPNFKGKGWEESEMKKEIQRLKKEKYPTSEVEKLDLEELPEKELAPNQRKWSEDDIV